MCLTLPNVITARALELRAQYVTHIPVVRIHSRWLLPKGPVRVKGNNLGLWSFKQGNSGWTGRKLGQLQLAGQV